MYINPTLVVMIVKTGDLLVYTTRKHVCNSVRSYSNDHVCQWQKFVSDLGQTSIESEQVKDIASAFLLQRNSGAEDKHDGVVPWVCSRGECHVCNGVEPNKACVIATSAPGRIHLLLQYNGSPIVEGDVTGAQAICHSDGGYKVCLIATEVDIQRYSAHLYMSVETPDVAQIVNLGSITIPQANIAKDVLTMFLGHHELVQ